MNKLVVNYFNYIKHLNTNKNTSMNELQNLIGDLHSYSSTTKETSLGGFNALFMKIATCLMNKLRLNAGERKYRIAECEIYYNDGMSHKDPYLYGSNDIEASRHQTKTLHWYFHYSGLDLSIGNNRDIKGGILIRTIQEVDESNVLGQFLNGPLILLMRHDGILNNIVGNAFTGKLKLYLENWHSEGCDKEVIVPSIRIGLDKTKIINELNSKTNVFFNREYRFATKTYAETTTYINKTNRNSQRVSEIAPIA